MDSAVGVEHQDFAQIGDQRATVQEVADLAHGQRAAGEVDQDPAGLRCAAHEPLPDRRIVGRPWGVVREEVGPDPQVQRPGRFALRRVAGDVVSGAGQGDSGGIDQPRLRADARSGGVRVRGFDGGASRTGLRVGFAGGCGDGETWAGQSAVQHIVGGGAEDVADEVAAPDLGPAEVQPDAGVLGVAGVLGMLENVETVRAAIGSATAVGVRQGRGDSRVGEGAVSADQDRAELSATGAHRIDVRADGFQFRAEDVGERGEMAVGVLGAVARQVVQDDEADHLRLDIERPQSRVLDDRPLRPLTLVELELADAAVEDTGGGIGPDRLAQGGDRFRGGEVGRGDSLGVAGALYFVRLEEGSLRDRLAASFCFASARCRAYSCRSSPIRWARSSEFSPVRPSRASRSSCDIGLSAPVLALVYADIRLDEHLRGVYPLDDLGESDMQADAAISRLAGVFRMVDLRQKRRIGLRHRGVLSVSPDLRVELGDGPLHGLLVEADHDRADLVAADAHRHHRAPGLGEHAAEDVGQSPEMAVRALLAGDQVQPTQVGDVAGDEERHHAVEIGDVVGGALHLVVLEPGHARVEHARDLVGGPRLEQGVHQRLRRGWIDVWTEFGEEALDLGQELLHLRRIGRRVKAGTCPQSGGLVG
ncbi:hypothetical protein [Nocardia sp. NPDC004604]|uniref:hypothetical protein n=1 Tax=Nocardia sp. NPDC004604 TaxID=3157013 RepID=UPI0033A8D244